MTDPIQELLERIARDPDFSKKLEQEPDSLRAEGKLEERLWRRADINIKNRGAN